MTDSLLLPATLGAEEIVVGDLMPCNVLQDLVDELSARRVEALLLRFDVVAMTATRSPCARSVISVPFDLHNDRAFRPMARHLGRLEMPTAVWASGAKQTKEPILGPKLPIVDLL